MTFSIAGVTAWFHTTEQDVVNLITNIKNDITVAESDVVSALKWLSGEVPTIVAALQTAVGLASAVGVVSQPELLAANAAVAALTAFAGVQNATTTAPAINQSAQAVVAGYVAYTQANAAVNAAKATAAAAPAKKA